MPRPKRPRSPENWLARRGSAHATSSDLSSTAPQNPVPATSAHRRARRWWRPASAPLVLLLGLLPAGCERPAEAPPAPPPSDGDAAAADAAPPTPPAPIVPPGAVPRARLRHLDLRIERSLEAAAVAELGAKAGAQLSQQATRILRWWLKRVPRDIHRGDRATMVYEIADGDQKWPELHALWYERASGRTPKVAVRWAPPAPPSGPLGAVEPVSRWYNADGTELEKRLRPSPLRDYEQISAFLGDGRGHRGMDFKAAEGTPVYATFSGKVVRKNWSTRRNGLCLAVRKSHSSVEALYLHLSAIAPGIRVGKRVQEGTRLGDVGNTGRSTAPHLHYQLQRGRRVIDPLRFHRTYRQAAAKAYVSTIQATLKYYDSVRKEES